MQAGGGRTGKAEPAMTARHAGFAPQFEQADAGLEQFLALFHITGMNR